MVFVVYVSVANVRSIGFFFFFLIFSQGPICDDFIYRLVPDFQTITTFYSFVQIQQNRRPLLRYDPLYPVKQLKHVFESLNFEFQTV